MAAHVICPGGREWPIISRFLRACQQGAIVLTPQARQQFIDAYQEDPVELGLIEYGFGGEPDLVLDVVRRLDDRPLAWDAIRDALGIDPDCDEGSPRSKPPS